MEKLKNQKQLILERFDQKKMVFSVQGFLVLQKIMNVYVENINE